MVPKVPRFQANHITRCASRAVSIQPCTSTPCAVVCDLGSLSWRAPGLLHTCEAHQSSAIDKFIKHSSLGPRAEFTFDRRPESTTGLLECRRGFSTWRLVGGSRSDVIRCEWSRPSVNVPKRVWENPALLKNANVTLTVETWAAIYHDTNLRIYGI